MSSIEKINYTHRLLKQIERKLIIEKISKLPYDGLDLTKYQYIGLGSIYYYDFILFHKYLHINKMTCYEKNDYKNRMEFNRPYDFIKLKFGDITDSISSEIRAEQEINSFIWLDFDDKLTDKIMATIGIIPPIMKEKSIFCITLNAYNRSYLSDDSLTGGEATQAIYDSFINKYSEYMRDFSVKDFSLKIFPKTLGKIILRKIDSSIPRDMVFQRFFNYEYQDGTKMITIGGLFCNKDNLCSHIEDLGDNITVIKVPPLTSIEKKYLDKNILSLQEKETSEESFDLPFELEDDCVKDYLKYYKQYPKYIESII